MNTALAEANRAYVRELLAERDPGLLARLDAFVDDPAGPSAYRLPELCECCLNKARRFHAGYCAVAPGQPLRISGAGLAGRLGLDAAGSWAAFAILNLLTRKGPPASEREQP